MAIDAPADQAPSASEPGTGSATIPEPAASSDPAATGDVAHDVEPEGGPAPSGPEGDVAAGNPPPNSIVVQCPNCATSFPLTAETEAVLPPLSDRYMQCPECEGTTWVQTGSSDPEHATIKCEGCGGAGYLRKDGLPTATALPSTMQPPWEGATWDEERELWV